MSAKWNEMATNDRLNVLRSLINKLGTVTQSDLAGFEARLRDLPKPRPQKVNNYIRKGYLQSVEANGRKVVTAEAAIEYLEKAASIEAKADLDALIDNEIESLTN